MTAITVAEMIEALSKLPPDAPVILRGSSETFDGYSHPFIELDSDGEVVIREADEDEALGIAEGDTVYRIGHSHQSY